jgi:hypothetical protein
MTCQIFLKTALFKGRDRELSKPVFEVHGTLEHRDGGLDVVISTLLDANGKEVESPWTRIFLPLGKIDHYIPTDA